MLTQEQLAGLDPAKRQEAMTIMAEIERRKTGQPAAQGILPSQNQGILPGLANALNFSIGRTTSPTGATGSSDMQNVLNRAYAQRAVETMYPSASDQAAQMSLEEKKRENERQVGLRKEYETQDTTTEPLAPLQPKMQATEPPIKTDEMPPVETEHYLEESADGKIVRKSRETEASKAHRELWMKKQEANLKAGEVKAAEAPRLANWQDALQHKKELEDLLFIKDPNTGEVKFREYTKPVTSEKSAPILASKYPFGTYGYEGQRINDLLKELEIASAMTRVRRGVSGMEGTEDVDIKKALAGSSKARLNWRQNPKALYDKLQSDYDTIMESAKGVGGKVGEVQGGGIPSFATEEEAEASGVKGEIMIAGRRARID